MLRLLVCAFLLGLTSLPAWGICRSENRVGGSPVFASDFASLQIAKPIDTPSENLTCGYDFASGVHIYLYAQDDPVNMDDPSGNDGDLISLSITEDIGASLDSMEGVVEVGAEATEEETLAAAEAMETQEAGAALGESAGEVEEEIARTTLKQEGKSVRGLIEQAKKLTNLAKNIKVIPMPRSVIPAVCANISDAFLKLRSPVLKRVSNEQKVENREAALLGRGSAGVGMSWDEYPFASGTPIPPSKLPAVVKAVPWWQNSVQGGIIAGCYSIEKIKANTPYIVVVVP